MFVLFCTYLGVCIQLMVSLSLTPVIPFALSGCKLYWVSFVLRHVPG